MLLRIHGWLDRLAPLDFVAVPLLDQEGRSLIECEGRLIQVEPWLDGESDCGRPPGLGRLRAGLSGLGAVHARLASLGRVGPSPGLGERLAAAETLARGGPFDLQSALDAAPTTPERDLALRWLELARRAAPALVAELRKTAVRPVPIQPCLRDLRPDHLLFRGDRLTGIVDYGAMGEETPAADLARLLPAWIGPDRAARAEALAAYLTTATAGPETPALIESFERSADVLTGGVWARWHFVEARGFEKPDAVRQGLAGALDRLIGRVAGGPPV